MIDKGCPSMEWRPGKEIDDEDDGTIAVYNHPGGRDREIMIDGDESKENINNDVINETEGQVTAHIEESAPDDNFEEEETIMNMMISTIAYFIAAVETLLVVNIVSLNVGYTGTDGEENHENGSCGIRMVREGGVEC